MTSEKEKIMGSLSLVRDTWTLREGVLPSEFTEDFQRDCDYVESRKPLPKQKLMDERPFAFAVAAWEWLCREHPDQAEEILTRFEESL